MSAYPALPNGATGAVYASANCPADSADGSAAHPFPALGQAVKAASPGNAVLAASGLYEENLILDRTVSVVGFAGSERGEAAGIILQAPNPDAITIRGANDVFIQGIQVVGAKDVGIVVRGGSLTVDSSWIADTTAVTDPSLGYGVVVRDSGSIILQNSSVIHSHNTGVVLYASHGKIVESTVSDNEGGGIRLDRSADESVVQDTLLANNVGFGIAVFGAKGSLQHNEIRGVRMGSTGLLDGIADGIIGSGVEDEGFPPQGASVTAVGNTITDAGRVGALFSHNTGQIILQNNHVERSAQVASFGAGIWLQQGAGDDSSSVISGNEIKDSKFVGIGATGTGTSMVLRDNDIIGTTLGSTFTEEVLMSLGDGIGVFGSRAEITGNRVKSCGRIGVVLDGANAETKLTDNVVEENVYGVVQQNQPELNLASNMIQLNTMLDQRVVRGDEAPFDVRSDDFDIQVTP